MNLEIRIPLNRETREKTYDMSKMIINSLQNLFLIITPYFDVNIVIFLK